MRDLNSSTARAVPRYTPHYPGGKLWARRYSNEFLPAAEDLEEYFFYIALQAVQDGLVEKISEQPGYNFFHDAVWGIKRQKKVMNWSAYYEAKRSNSKVNTKDYLTENTLEYKRLPGYEELTQRQYATLMYKKLEQRRVELVRSRYRSGKGFAGKATLLKKVQGSTPYKTKKSTADSHRPRVLCVCPKRRAQALNWYFSIYYEYKTASKLYSEGCLEVEFPPGTYRPCRFAM